MSKSRKLNDRQISIFELLQRGAGDRGHTEGQLKVIDRLRAAIQRRRGRRDKSGNDNDGTARHNYGG